MFKKLLFLFLLISSITAMKTQGQTLPSFNPSSTYYIDSCAQKIVTGTIDLGSITTDTQFKVVVHWGDGNTSEVMAMSIAAEGWAGSFFADHEYEVPGVYTMTAYLYSLLPFTSDLGEVIDSVSHTFISSCYFVYGYSYLRGNSNCVFDTLIDQEIHFANKYEVRKNNVPMDTLVSYGSYYSYYFQSEDIDFTAEYSIIPIEYEEIGLILACPSPSADTHKFSLDTLNTSNNQKDFHYDIDASFTGFDLMPLASGVMRTTAATSFLHIAAANKTVVPKSGTVTLEISPKYTFESSTPAPASISGSMITWNFSDLNIVSAPYSFISVNLMATSTTSLGDTAHNIITMSPTEGDLNPEDNTFTSIKTVVAAYDPNDKAVTPLGAIEAGQELTYTIQFENLGNDTAFNIHILDTLSANLDHSSFELLFSTHNVNTIFKEVDGKQLLKFDFPHIKLASKYFPNENKGMVVFKMKAKESMEVGDEILNNAAIYFDINPAVVTNTVRNYIDTPSSINTQESAKLVNVYPNPSKDVLHIDLKGNPYTKILVTNALGHAVLQQTLHTEQGTINTAPLPSGIYFLTLSGDDLAPYTIKFIRK